MPRACVHGNIVRLVNSHNLCRLRRRDEVGHDPPNLPIFNQYRMALNLDYERHIITISSTGAFLCAKQRNLLFIKCDRTVSKPTSQVDAHLRGGAVAYVT